MACCGKMMCTGCIHVVQSRAILSGRLEEDNICPFCRVPNPKDNEDILERYEKRSELKDARAICNLACYYNSAQYGLQRDQTKALELWQHAGELGSADAYYDIGSACVERDEKKALYYWELAAARGHGYARHNLGVMEWNSGNMDRALKHWMIAVKDGCSNSLESIKMMYMDGESRKEDYTKALRFYQAYLDEIKSEQRDEAAEAHDRKYYY